MRGIDVVYHLAKATGKRTATLTDPGNDTDVNTVAFNIPVSTYR